MAWCTVGRSLERLSVAGRPTRRSPGRGGLAGDCKPVFWGLVGVTSAPPAPISASPRRSLTTHTRTHTHTLAPQYYVQPRSSNPRRSRAEEMGLSSSFVFPWKCFLPSQRVIFRCPPQHPFLPLFSGAADNWPTTWTNKYGTTLWDSDRFQGSSPQRLGKHGRRHRARDQGRDWRSHRFG